jgi:hypothetical protein
MKEYKKPKIVKENAKGYDSIEKKDFLSDNDVRRIVHMLLRKGQSLASRWWRG